MATSVVTAPPLVGLSKTPFFTIIGTDQVGLNYSYFTMAVTLPGPTAGQTVSFTFGTTTIAFTVATTPDASGTQIPTWTGIGLSAYIDLLITHFNYNEIMLDNFNILNTGGTSVTLALKEPGVITISQTETLSNVTVTATNSLTPVHPVGLSAVLKLYKQNYGGGESAIVTLNAPFDINTASVAFDLHRVFALEPHLPTTLSISTLATGVATKAFNRYYYRYGERKGVPAVATKLAKGTESSVIYGGKAGVNFALYPPSATIFNCHNYRKSDYFVWTKPVTKDQPDWLYFFVRQTLSPAYLYYFRVVVLWTDGSSSNHDLAPIVPEDRTMYWISAGYTQLGLGSLTPPSVDAEIVSYNCYLKESGSATSYHLGAFYVECDCGPWNNFLLMDNGVGGLETVWCQGKKKTTYTAERETARRVKWTDFDKSIGDVIPIQAEGQTVLEINTGWHDIEYIQHLKQLLLGELWLVDSINSVFIKVAMDTKSLEIMEDDQDLFSLNFTVKVASYDASAQFT